MGTEEDPSASFRQVQELFRRNSRVRLSEFPAWIRTVGVPARPGSPLTATSLLASAGRHAARGLRARAADDHDDAALQLGIMFEHVAKAYLAHVHPTLLIDGRIDFPSLVALAGEGHRLQSGYVLRTVGMHEALTRIGMLQQPGNVHAGSAFAKQYSVVLEARNAIAHAGHLGGLVADEVAELAVRGVDTVLRMMDRTIADVFGQEYTEAATALLDEHATKVQQRVTLLLGRARQSFAERGAGIDPGRRAADLDTADRLTELSTVNNDGKVPFRCPACQRRGILTGSPVLEIEPDEVSTDAGGELHFESLSLLIMLSADGFDCPACGLRLHGSEELTQAGLPPSAPVREGLASDLETYLGAPHHPEVVNDDEGDGDS